MAETMSWQRWLRQGDQYLSSAAPNGKKSKFTSNIRYNLLSMSLESYVMAILDFYNTMPADHTYTDLLDGLATVLSEDETLKKRLLKYDNLQFICALEKYHIKQPTELELADLRNAILQMGALAHETCASPIAV